MGFLCKRRSSCHRSVLLSFVTFSMLKVGLANENFVFRSADKRLLGAPVDPARLADSSTSSRIERARSECTSIVGLMGRVALLDAIEGVARGMFCGGYKSGTDCRDAPLGRRRYLARLFTGHEIRNKTKRNYLRDSLECNFCSVSLRPFVQCSSYPDLFEFAIPSGKDGRHLHRSFCASRLRASRACKALGMASRQTLQHFVFVREE